MESIEEEIEKTESEIKEIEDIFSSPDFYKYAEQTNEFNSKLADAKQKIKSLYERWEELENIKSGNV